MRRTLHRVALIVSLVTLAGCPAPTYHFPFDYAGQPGTPVDLTFYSDVPMVEVVVDGGDPHEFLVDTGAPATICDAAVFGLPPDVYATETIDTLGITVLGLDIAVLALFGGNLAVGGILGGDVFRNFALTLDYRGAVAVLYEDLDGAPPPLAGDFGPVTTRAFALRGGGLLYTPSGTALRVPATRVVVQLVIEDRPVWAVLDTGASSLILDEPLYEQLLDERPDRPVLQGYQVLTVDAAQDVEITRLAEVRVAGEDATADAVQTSVPALVVLGSDALPHLSAETGRDIQALLGGAFLRYYQLTIDYPARQLTLQPFTQTDHVDPEEYVSVGFTWEQQGVGVVYVEQVIPGSDAELQGVLAGDRILTAGPYDVQLTGEGGVGSAVAAAEEGDTVAFTLERADATQIYDVLVEDLLPPFP